MTAAQTVAVTIVNHVSRDIAATQEAVWEIIVDEYVEAAKFRELGYTLEPLTDPGAVLGGYRMRLEKDGALIDDRICRITELDESARRLSLYSINLNADDGMVVYATYHSEKTTAGARYAIDCHSTLGVEPAGDGGRADIAAAVVQLKAQFDAALVGYLEGNKKRLETGR
jgi:hypothetical protein